MLESIKNEVYRATKSLGRDNLTSRLMATVSVYDRESGHLIIRPSGVASDQLTAEKILVVDRNDTVVEGEGQASSDIFAHIELYQAFPEINAIAHIYSHYALSFSQALRSVPCYGVLHADYFKGEIPCTRDMNQREVSQHYDRHVGRMILEALRYQNTLEIPGILVARQGAFTWGKSVAQVMRNAHALEEAAHLAFDTEILRENTDQLPGFWQEKRFYRHHSRNDGKS